VGDTNGRRIPFVDWLYQAELGNRRSDKQQITPYETAFDFVDENKPNRLFMWIALWCTRFRVMKQHRQQIRLAGSLGSVLAYNTKREIFG